MFFYKMVFKKKVNAETKIKVFVCHTSQVTEQENSEFFSLEIHNFLNLSICDFALQRHMRIFITSIMEHFIKSWCLTFFQFLMKLSIFSSKISNSRFTVFALQDFLRTFFLFFEVIFVISGIHPPLNTVFDKI